MDRIGKGDGMASLGSKWWAIRANHGCRPLLSPVERTGRWENATTQRERMNKLDIAGRVTGWAGVGRSVAKEAVFEAIAKALARGEDVRIAGFGTFGTKRRVARTRRNPRPDESPEVAASTALTLKAGKLLRDAVNAKRVSWFRRMRQMGRM